MVPSESGALAACFAIALSLIASARRRRMLQPAMSTGEEEQRGLRGLRVLADFPSQVSCRPGVGDDAHPWYGCVVVTDCSSSFGAGGGDVVRGLHLGSAENPPESLVRLRLHGDEWRPVASALLKSYARFSLLAFAWLDGGFRADSRACLVGLGGGSLLHFWLGCVHGGDAVRVDAIELDGAVLEAARRHLGLGAAEATGRVTCHVGDGGAWLRSAEDEAFDLVVCDLDVGSLLDADASAVRHLYRVLSERGVLAVNEYSDGPSWQRLRRVLRAVRALRRFFPEVHVVRTTPRNVLYLAPVDARGWGREELAAQATRCGEVLGLAGVDAGALLRELPPNRVQVYS
jgi:SAM-dependent methyltransferase